MRNVKLELDNLYDGICIEFYSRISLHTFTLNASHIAFTQMGHEWNAEPNESKGKMYKIHRRVLLSTLAMQVVKPLFDPNDLNIFGRRI